MKKYLIVGAGLSGSVIANLIANELEEKVLVIDRKEHIAGNCFDFRDKNGIMIHKYGPHAFHTNSEDVWNYVSRYTNFHSYEHKVLANIDGIETNIPFNLNTLYDVFPNNKAKNLESKLLENFEYGSKVPILEFRKQNDKDLLDLADYIYEKIFLHYTEKQWGMSPEELDKSVTGRVPVFISRDNRYFQDKYQGIPQNGYTQFVKNLLEHKNIQIQLETDYKSIDSSGYEKIFYTGAIDEYYNYEYGELPYRSVYFKHEEYNKEYYQSNTSINYPCSEDYTRVHEYKYFLDDKSDKTIVTREFSEQFSQGKNERFYPIPKSENQELYNMYFEKAKLEKNIYFLGRLGDYKYYNMDQAILRAMKMFHEIFS